MLTKITAKKIVYRGERYVRITKIEGVMKEEELPKKYLLNRPYYLSLEGCCNDVIVGYFEKGIDFITWNGEKSSTTHKNNYPGDLFTPDNFSLFISQLKTAGNRLAKINKEIEEETKKWNGNIEITI